MPLKIVLSNTININTESNVSIGSSNGWLDADDYWIEHFNETKDSPPYYVFYHYNKREDRHYIHMRF